MGASADLPRTTALSHPHPQYHDVAYEMCSDGFENISGPVTGAGGSYMLRVPEDAPTEELYVVCSVPGHCGTGQKLVIDVSPVYACNSGDDGQDEAEDDRHR